MSRLIDITGERYSRLLVLERAENTERGQAVWKCLCDCGNITYVRGGNLKSGAVKSCGCLLKDNAHRTHGLSHTKIYGLWGNIKRRCYCPTISCYKYYGGRGIKMCDEWRDSFDAFYEWVKATRFDDSLTIERIDPNGDYCPENCTWANMTEQANNKRNNDFYTHNGETKSLTQWCYSLGLDYWLVRNRIKKLGWAFERAISEPIHINKRNMEARKRKEGD